MNESLKNKKPVRAALGRGLGALVSAVPVPIVPVVAEPERVAANEDSQSDKTSFSVDRYLQIDQLVANAEQPRQWFSEAELVELASSIRTHGVLSPILVRPRGDRFEIVAGERRYRAAKLAGLERVPVLIRELSERETLEVAIVENIQRQNLNPVEEALAYKRLMDEFGLNAAEVGEKVGKERATVANVVRILSLPKPVIEAVQSGRLTLGHAKAILTVREPSVQLSLAKKVEDEALSVRALERIVSRSVDIEPPVQNDSKGEIKKRVLPARLAPVEEELRNLLGTKVTLSHDESGKGVVHVHYFSEQELDRLVHLFRKVI